MKCDNCGKKVKTVLGDTIIKIDDREVNVSNIPAFKCDFCGKKIIHAIVIERAIDYARQYGAKNNQLDFGHCERKESEDMPILSQSLGFYKNI